MNKRTKYKKQMLRDIKLFKEYNPEEPLKKIIRTVKKWRHDSLFNPHTSYNLKTGKLKRNKYPCSLIN